MNNAAHSFARPSALSVRQGFSLIEAAIVLAVIGLVVGGIWLGAAAVRRSYMVQDVAKVIVLAGQEIYRTIPQSTAYGTVLTTTLVNMKVIPANWQPFGNSYNIYVAGSGSKRVDIQLLGLSRENCINIINAVAAQVKPNGNSFEAIRGVWHANAYIAFPLTPSTSYCTTATNDVTFVINLVAN